MLTTKKIVCSKHFTDNDFNSGNKFKHLIKSLLYHQSSVQCPNKNSNENVGASAFVYEFIEDEVTEASKLHLKEKSTEVGMLVESYEKRWIFIERNWTRQRVESKSCLKQKREFQ